MTKTERKKKEEQKKRGEKRQGNVWLFISFSETCDTFYLLKNLGPVTSLIFLLNLKLSQETVCRDNNRERKNKIK